LSAAGRLAAPLRGNFPLLSPLVREHEPRQAGKLGNPRDD